MVNLDAAKKALIAYFDYQDTKAGNGYPRDSVVAKMIKGNIGSGSSGSRPPCKVEMTDLGFLQLVSRVEVAIDKLKARNNRAYRYLCLRYRDNYSQEQIAKELGCKRTTCHNLHITALEFIDCEDQVRDGW